METKSGGSFGVGFGVGPFCFGKAKANNRLTASVEMEDGGHIKSVLTLGGNV